MSLYSYNFDVSQASNSGTSVTGGIAGGNGYGPSFGGNFKEGFGSGSSSGFSFSSSFGFGGAESSSFGGLVGSEKQTMQNLNDRLAVYLEKVRDLEATNIELEIMICEWYDKQIDTGAEAKDYSKYYKVIKGLKRKILAARVENSQIALETDNARLAADDFKLKYENELAFRLSVDSDIQGLNKDLDEHLLSKGDFEVQIGRLTKELAYLKENHKEEVQIARSSAVGQVNVEMDAAPGEDLTKILNDMRADYEALAAKNRRDAETWYEQKSKDLKKEISASVEQVQTSKSEISDLRRRLEGLEIELQSQLAMEKSLGDTLADTDGRYGARLQQLQLVISETEEQLTQIRSSMESQSLEYSELFDIKTRLEKEIETYHYLLEGELGQLDSHSSSIATESTVTISSSSTVSTSQVAPSYTTVSLTSSKEPLQDPTKIITVKTIVEEVIDGIVVSSRVEGVEEKVI
ncbi:keratin, type I cytoskeletal 47 kDa-like [Pyxicephalus adspersus]|uniref:keratin, type I cytoskeletal 47 kDa-like n=1 Tax=Pyxicephalus adspersus TaxID=30357 RepID=UPI003B594296